MREWQETVDRLLALYGSALLFDSAEPREVCALDVAALDDTRAFTVMFPSQER